MSEVKSQTTSALWRLYRFLMREDGAAGTHRGMTALDREQWRAISEARLKHAIRIAEAVSG